MAYVYGSLDIITRTKIKDRITPAIKCQPKKKKAKETTVTQNSEHKIAAACWSLSLSLPTSSSFSKYTVPKLYNDQIILFTKVISFNKRLLSVRSFIYLCFIFSSVRVVIHFHFILISFFPVFCFKKTKLAPNERRKKIIHWIRKVKHNRNERFHRFMRNK